MNAVANLRVDAGEKMSVLEELMLAKAEREAGYVGRTLDEVLRDAELIVERAENEKAYSTAI